MKKNLLIVVTILSAVSLAEATQLDLTSADVRVQTATNAANPVRYDQLVTNWNGIAVPPTTGIGMVVWSNSVIHYMVTNPVPTYTSYWSLQPDGSMTWVEWGPSPTAGAYTNKAQYTYTGGDQTFTVPAGITNVFVKCWGAGGGAALTAEGGFSSYVHEVTPGAVLLVRVGGKGSGSAALNAYPAGGWPDGGAGANSNGSYTAYGGSGSSSVWLGTSLLQVAGGAGGATMNTTAGGAGGGVTGSDGAAGSAANGGTGGSQAAGGITNGALYATTNTISGGAASMKAAVSNGGGGGGYYGGGGGRIAAAYQPGGGGSGYIPSTFGPGAALLRDNADYDVDWVASWGAANNTGAIVIKY